MPRSILEILLEKKENLIYSSESQVYNSLKNSLERAMNCLNSIKGLRGFGGIDTFDEIERKLKTFKSDIETYISQLDKGGEKGKKWNDLEFQKIIKGKEEEIGGEKGLDKELSKLRISSLGSKDKFMKANSFFETAESLRSDAEGRVLKISQIRDSQIKSAEQRSTTDPLKSFIFDPDKMDIVAKKGKDTKTSSDPKKEEEEKKEIARKKNGLFYYLSMILGVTREEVKSAWASEDEKNLKMRKELLQKAVPFIEKVAGKDFDEENPGGDQEYMDTIMALSRYNPGYKNYKPDPKEEVEITKDEYTKIEGFAKGKKEKMTKKLDSILERHKGDGPVDKEITKKIGEAKSQLASVSAKTACDLDSRDALQTAKKDIEDKISKYGKYLDKKDVEDLEQIHKEIIGIFDYCYNEKYREKEEKK